MELTLDELKWADVGTAFDRPYGMKKVANGGSLTTKEFNDAIFMPFDKQRPITILENTTITKIEYDAKLLINASGVTLTLNNGTAGIKLTIFASHAFNLVMNNRESVELPIGSYPLVYNGTSWELEGFNAIHPIGDTYVQYPQQSSPNELWGAFSTWEVINYDGAFFRAEGTNAEAFAEKTDDLIVQNEGLPNITGFCSTSKGGGNGRVVQNGALAYVHQTSSGYSGGSSHYIESAVMHLDASNGETKIDGTLKTDDEYKVYGSSNHVTPYNVTIKVWKRIS